MSETKRYTIKEYITGRMCYYYDIEAESEVQAMEIYKNSYPSDDGADFFPDDNGENYTEIQDA